VKGWIVNSVAGVVLFAASLAGALAVTGRLDAEGVAGIPLLNRLFPKPAAPASPGADAGTTDAAPRGESLAADARHGGQEPQTPEPAPLLKRGRSIFPEGEGGASSSGQKPPERAATSAGAPQGEAAAPKKPHPAERDFDGAPAVPDRPDRYAPGGYFKFDGMPSGMTADKLNEAWHRAQEVLADLEKQKQALQLRENELRAFADDVARRQTELGKERIEVENLQRRLDERIEAFQQQVKLVRTDEVAGLRRNAQTLESFEPSKAAELITEQWKLEAGQDELLKTLEFMNAEAVDAILAVLPNAMIREVLQKRLKVTKAPMPTASPGR
jgi:hypothetical protein